MDRISEKIKNLLLLMGFSEVSAEFEETHRKISVHIGDNLTRDEIGYLLPFLETAANLMVRHENLPVCILDVNYYRKERERLISELARAAARKAVATKSEVELPAMNAYERRLVHVEIMTHPELTTESVGAGKERRVVIKHVS